MRVYLATQNGWRVILKTYLCWNNWKQRYKNIFFIFDEIRLKLDNNSQTKHVCSLFFAIKILRWQTIRLSCVDTEQNRINQLQNLGHDRCEKRERNSYSRFPSLKFIQTKAMKPSKVFFLLRSRLYKDIDTCDRKVQIERIRKYLFDF